LGKELGLFEDLSSQEYALQWQALRATRVLLDIGIHYHNWDDEQARALWMDLIPKQKNIMEREIARIRRWPVQVISYVYGKNKIEEAIVRLSKTKGMAQARRQVMSMSNQTLSSLSLLN